MENSGAQIGIFEYYVYSKTPIESQKRTSISTTVKEKKP